jgi:hypothetical protein
MSSFEDLVVNGLLTARNLVSPISQAQGIAALAATLPALTTGTAPVVLPDWTPQAGPCLLALDGSAGSCIVSGFQGDSAQVTAGETPTPGSLMMVVNFGSATIEFHAADTGSPVGYRFAETSFVHAGAGLWLYGPTSTPNVYAWYPVYPQSS